MQTVRHQRHVFEKGDCGQSELSRFAQREHFLPIFESKVHPKTGKWFCPFQGADLIGWEHRRLYTDVTKSVFPGFRES
ncbi:MAG: hypothetical protein MN733_13300, partial [Nitrososphaera sp.]|nr:hypothetical protein [Nitrososphaera sp.]